MMKWFIIALGLVLILSACESAQQASTQQSGNESVKNRVPTLPSDPNARITVPTSDPTPPTPAPEPKPKDLPMYGSTLFIGTITSVYYYPQGGNSNGTPDGAATHVKFDYRDDDIWLCGDQRSKLTPGDHARMLVTFEPNTDCQTNWKLR